MEDFTDDIYILNEKNIYITKEFIEGIFKGYGIEYKVHNLNTFQMAMIHSSYTPKTETKHRNKPITRVVVEPIDDPNKAIPIQKKSYEELELLGDSVIHLILADYFTTRYEDEGEGFMTKLRTKVESGDTLSHFSKTIGLNKYVLISRYLECTNSRDENKSILEDTFEAFIGATYRDSPTGVNFEKCREFIINLVEREVDIAEMLHNENNYKDLLLQYFHVRKWEDPMYNKLGSNGAEQGKIFSVVVIKKEHPKDVGVICGTGFGTSKKKAEQHAAKLALEYLQKS